MIHDAMYPDAPVTHATFSVPVAAPATADELILLLPLPTSSISEELAVVCVADFPGLWGRRQGWRAICVSANVLSWYSVGRAYGRTVNGCYEVSPKKRGNEMMLTY